MGGDYGFSKLNYILQNVNSLLLNTNKRIALSVLKTNPDALLKAHRDPPASVRGYRGSD